MLRGNAMKKIAVIFIIVIALITGTYVGAAYVCGIMAERHINEIVYNPDIPYSISITDHRYDRGIFSSDVSTDIELYLPHCTDPSKKLSLTMKNYVKHGPWPFGKSASGHTYSMPALAVIETTISPTAGTTGKIQKVVNKFLNRSSMLTRTIINFNTGGESTSTMNAFTETLGEGKECSVTWKGLKQHVSFSRGFQEIKGTITLPGLDARASSGSVAVEDIQCSVNLHKVADDFYLGTSSVTVGLMDIVDDTEKKLKFQMKKVCVNSSSKESGTTMFSHNTIDIVSIVTGDVTVGPIRCDMEFRNLDVPSMIKLSNSFRDAQKMVALNSKESMDKLIVKSYLDILPVMLKASPRIELKDLSVKTNKGDVSGKLSLACDGTKINANLNPLMIIGAVSANFECAVTPNLLLDILMLTKKEKLKNAQGHSISPDEIDDWAQAESKQQINFLLNQNILVQSDDSLSLKAKYANGMILINGQPMPLFNLLQRQKL